MTALVQAAVDPAHPGDFYAAVVLIVVAVGGYLVHCQRQHVKRKTSRRTRSN